MYTPILAALGFILSPDQKKTLLVHRIKREDDLHFGKYNGLGGKMEPGEDIITCLRREILEESGYDQELDIYDREFMEGIEHEREINPTIIAQKQLLDGKIKYKYIAEKEVSINEEPSE